MKSIINENSKGLLHGYQETYWSNGQLWLKCFYNNGIIADYEERYWFNGKLRHKCFYI